MNRDQFLQRIRQNLPRAVLPGAAASHPGSFTGYTFAADLPPARLVEQFRQELEALSGHVHVMSSPTEAIETVLALLRREHADRVLAWDEAGLALPGLTAALSEAGIQIEDGVLPSDPQARAEKLAQLDPIRVGLTGAEAGLADTGALALVSGPGQGRLASLLPPVHIAILPVSRLYPSLPAFLAQNPTAAADGSNLVFIAGPSRTGDIEMVLTLGVHGPGTLHVVLYEKDEG